MKKVMDAVGLRFAGFGLVAGMWAFVGSECARFGHAIIPLFS